MRFVERCLSLWGNYQMYYHRKLFPTRKRLICHFITQLQYCIHVFLEGEFQ